MDKLLDHAEKVFASSGVSVKHPPIMLILRKQADGSFGTDSRQPSVIMSDFPKDAEERREYLLKASEHLLASADGYILGMEAEADERGLIYYGETLRGEVVVRVHALNEGRTPTISITPSMRYVGDESYGPAAGLLLYANTMGSA